MRPQLFSLTRMFSSQTVPQRDAWDFSVIVGVHSLEDNSHVVLTDLKPFSCNGTDVRN